MTTSILTKCLILLLTSTAGFGQSSGAIIQCASGEFLFGGKCLSGGGGSAVSQNHIPCGSGCDINSGELIVTTHIAQNPPSPVRINGNEWTIKPFESAKDFPRLDGYTSCASHTIYWRKPQYQTTQLIIWHELLHAGACYGTLEDIHWWDSPDPAKHEGIYRLSNFLYEFTRDNPEMAKWLIGEK